MMTDISNKSRHGSGSQERYLFILLFLASFLMAIYELGIIKQFTVTMYNVQASAYISYAFMHIFSGIGSYFAYRFFDTLSERRKIRFILLSTGLAIIASLFSVLAFNIEQPLSIVATVFFVSLAFLTLGIIYGLVIIYFCRAEVNKTGAAVAISFIGLMLGFLIEPYLAVHIGVNASLLLVGCLFTFLCFKRPAYSCLAFLILLGIIFKVPVDTNIEKLRVIDYDLNQRIPMRIFKKKYRVIFDSWSPYAKLNILRGKGKKREKIILGAYNYRVYWVAHEKYVIERLVPYYFIDNDDNVLVIGASAGDEINRMRPERIITKENTTMVEIDPLVVKYFKVDHPEYNDNIFNRGTAIAADGRSVIDEMKEKKDVIIIGTLESAARNIWMFSEFKNNLYTIENFRRCFEILGDDGVLMIYREEDNPALVNAIGAALERLGAHLRVYKIPFFLYGKELGLDRFYIYASKSQEKIEKIDSLIERSGIKSQRVKVGDASFLSDDRNFTNLASESSVVVVRAFLIVFASILLLMSAIILFIRRKQSRRIMLYFFLIGNGFFLTQLFLVAKFRSFFSHPLKTFMVVTTIFLLTVSVGNILSRRIPVKDLKQRILFHGLAVILVLLWFNITISHIPFTRSNIFEKLLASLIIISPMGILCGLYYPLGLVLGRKEHLGLAIFLDSLGACLAFFVFYLLYWMSGVSASFYPIAFCYLAATVLISIYNSHD